MEAMEASNTKGVFLREQTMLDAETYRIKIKEQRHEEDMRKQQKLEYLVNYIYTKFKEDRIVHMLKDNDPAYKSGYFIDVDYITKMGDPYKESNEEIIKKLQKLLVSDNWCDITELKFKRVCIHFQFKSPILNFKLGFKRTREDENKNAKPTFFTKIKDFILKLLGMPTSNK